MTLERKITDPSQELARLFESLVKAGKDNQSTAEVIANFGNLDTTQPEFMKAIGEINSRFSALLDLISKHRDNEHFEDFKEIAGSVRIVASVFNFDQLNRPWSDSKSRVKSHHILIMKTISKTVRDYAPLAVIGDDELAVAIEAVTLRITEIKADSELLDWMRSLLIDSLDRLRFCLVRQRYFSFGAILREIIFVRVAVENVKSTLRQQGGGSESLTGVIKTIGIVAALCILPADIDNASRFYLDALCTENDLLVSETGHSPGS